MVTQLQIPRPIISFNGYILNYVVKMASFIRLPSFIPTYPMIKPCFIVTMNILVI